MNSGNVEEFSRHEDEAARWDRASVECQRQADAHRRAASAKAAVDQQLNQNLLSDGRSTVPVMSGRPGSTMPPAPYMVPPLPVVEQGANYRAPVVMPAMGADGTVNRFDGTTPIVVDPRTGTVCRSAYPMDPPPPMGNSNFGAVPTPGPRVQPPAAQVPLKPPPEAIDDDPQTLASRLSDCNDLADRFREGFSIKKPANRKRKR